MQIAASLLENREDNKQHSSHRLVEREVQIVLVGVVVYGWLRPRLIETAAVVTGSTVS